MIDRINGGFGTLARWMTLLMVLIGAYNAVARWATRHVGVSLTSNTLNELQWYLFSAVFLLAAAYGLREDVHVRVDVLYGRFGDGFRGWIDLMGSVLFLLPFSVLMIWVSIPTVRNSWIIRETSSNPGGLPRYPIKALLIVCFVLLFLQGIAQAVRAFRTIRGAGGGDSGPDDGTRGPDASPPPTTRTTSAISVGKGSA